MQKNDNMKTSNFIREYFCGQCENCFKSGSDLKHHMKTIHNLDLKTYIRQFEVVLDKGPLVDSFTEDLSEETVNQNKEAVIKREKYAIPSTFNMDSVGQYTCDTCFKIYPKRRSLQNLNRYKHGKVSICKSCSKTFLTKKKLKCHESIHNGHKYFCQI